MVYVAVTMVSCGRKRVKRHMQQITTGENLPALLCGEALADRMNERLETESAAGVIGIAAAPVVAAAAAVTAAEDQQQDDDDDPAAIAAEETVVIAHSRTSNEIVG